MAKHEKSIFGTPQKHFYTYKGHKSISRQGLFDVTTKFPLPSTGTVKKRSYFRLNDPKKSPKGFSILQNKSFFLCH